MKVLEDIPGYQNWALSPRIKLLIDGIDFIRGYYKDIYKNIKETGMQVQQIYTTADGDRFEIGHDGTTNVFIEPISENRLINLYTLEEVEDIVEALRAAADEADLK